MAPILPYVWEKKQIYGLCVVLFTHIIYRGNIVFFPRMQQFQSHSHVCSEGLIRVFVYRLHSDTTSSPASTA